MHAAPRSSHSSVPMQLLLCPHAHAPRAEQPRRARLMRRSCARTSGRPAMAAPARLSSPASGAALAAGTCAAAAAPRSGPARCRPANSNQHGRQCAAAAPPARNTQQHTPAATHGHCWPLALRVAVCAMSRARKDKLSAPCGREVFKVQKAVANDYRADPAMAAACKADVEARCARVKDGGGRKTACLVSGRGGVRPRAAADGRRSCACVSSSSSCSDPGGHAGAA